MKNPLIVFCVYREVTGFVLFFHVYNLRSLRDLFPSLMVIRGRTLIGNYALIFYDLPDLEEVSRNLYFVTFSIMSFKSCFIDWFEEFDRYSGWIRFCTALPEALLHRYG